jgi:hypothetical protein
MDRQEFRDLLIVRPVATVRKQVGQMESTVWMMVKTTAARMAKGRDPQWVPTQTRYNDARFRIGGTRSPTAHLVE